MALSLFLTVLRVQGVVGEAARLTHLFEVFSSCMKYREALVSSFTCGDGLGALDGWR